MTDRQKGKPGYHRASRAASAIVGHPFLLACLLSAIIGWIVVGCLASFPTEWFLASDLVGTLAVFLLLLLLRYSQKLHMAAIHAKLDELIRAGDGGDHVIGSERLADGLLEEVRARHREMAARNGD